MPSPRGTSHHIMPRRCPRKEASSNGFWRLQQTVLLVWILCVGVQVCGAGKCPSGCSCQGQDQVDCSGAGLQAMPNPSQIESSISEYILTGNSISNINPSDLQPFRRLKLLYLDGNRLTSDQDLALVINNLKFLEQLYLGSNQFRSFHLKYFDSASLPKVLNISDNPIVNFAAEAQSRIPVENLYIENLLLSIFPTETLKSFTKLTRLYARGNPFTVIPAAAFKQHRKLIEIDLSYSSIVTLPAGLFNTTKALKSLFLSNGRLETLEQGLFDSISGLTVLDVSGNPLRCDCALTWLQTWVASSPKVQLHNPQHTTCSSWPSKPFLDVPIFYMCPVSYGSCVYNYERKTFTFRQFASAKSVVSTAGSCRQHCFDEGHTTFYYSANSSVCLCGTESSTCSCLSDSAALSRACANITLLDSSVHVLTGTVVSYSSPARLGHATRFSVQSALSSVVEYRWTFNDGSDQKTSASGTFSHTFLYTGDFSVQVDLCGPVACQPVTALLRVVSVSDQGRPHCPTAVKVLDKVNASVEFQGTSDAQISWTRISTNTGVKTSGGQCASGWQLYHGRCLRLFSGSQVPYRSASDACTSLPNTSLLTVLHPLEVPELISLFSIQDGVYVESQLSLSAYYWAGSHSPASFSSSRMGSLARQQCVVINSSGLVRVQCSESHFYMCQQGVLQCQEGHLAQNGSCFYLSTDQQTWQSAQQVCENSHNGHLAIVPDATLMSNLQQLLLSSTSSPDAAWVGLRSLTVATQFLWSDRSSLTIGQWASPSPLQPCGALTPLGQWQDYACSESHHYICQYTLTDVISNGQYAAGILDMLDSGAAFQTLTPTSQPVATGNSDFHLTLLPGSWFPHAGKLQRWTFRAVASGMASPIALQVYRPTCTRGTTAIPPGCGENRISVCGQTRACRTPTCSSDQVYCGLSRSCQKQSTPCNCFSIPAAASMPGDCNQHSSNLTYPSYTLVGQTFFSVSGSGIFTGDAGGLAVEAHDVIGFETRGRSQLTICRTDLTSQWRNTMVDSDVRAWKTVGDLVTPEGSWSRQENVLCRIAVSYSEGRVVSLPENLAYLPGPGQVQYQYESSDGTVSNSCEVLVEEEVEQLRWLYPESVSPCPSAIVVEQDAEQLLVIHVQGGSNLSAVWHTRAGEVITQFVSGCSSSLAATVPECATITSSADKPFSILTHRFAASDTLTLRVRNNISSEECSVHVTALLKIRGLTFFHSSCSNHTGCRAVVETGAPQTFIARILEGYASDYIYEVNGTSVGDRTTSNLTHTFQQPGTYVLSVNASSQLNSMMTVIEVEAKIRAYLRNCTFQGLPPAASVNATLQISFSATVDIGADISVVWLFSDGQPTTTTVLTTTSDLSITVSHTFASAGNQTVTVILLDTFDTVSSSAGIEIIDLLPPVFLRSQSVEVAVLTQVSFSATLSAAGLQYLGPLTYIWDFDDGSQRQMAEIFSFTDQIAHSFSSVGVYNVTVHVDSLLHTVSDVISVIVEEAVTGLGIRNNGPKKETETVTFSITKTSGSNLKYNVSFGDGSSPVVQADPTFTYVFARAGVYKVSVSASNILGEETATAKAYIMNSTTLIVLAIKKVNCTKTGEDVTLTPRIVNMNPSVLNYSWVCPGGQPDAAAGIGLNRMTTAFNRSGMHSVSVTVSSVSSTESVSSKVCVQDAVSDLAVSSPGFVGLDTGQSTSVRLTASANGTNVTYTWLQRGRVLGSGAAYNLRLKKAKAYDISVVAQNNISQVNQTVQLLALYKIERVAITCRECSANNSVAKDAVVNLSVNNHRGTNVTFTWFLDNQNVSMGPNFTHTFTAEGQFTVQVEATNAVSSVVESVVIIVLEGVGGLTLSQNTTVLKTGDAVLLQASVTHGSHVEYTWICNSTVHQRSSTSNVTIHFRVAGTANCSVTAANSATNSSKYVLLYVYEPLSLLDIHQSLVSGRYASANESTNFTAVANAFYGTKFTWQVVEDLSTTTILNSSGKDMQYTFPNPSEYTVHLTAENPVSHRATSMQVTAIMKISGVHIESNYTSTLSALQPLNVSVLMDRGSNVSFTWKHTWNSREQTLPYTTSSFLQTFPSSGTHVIRVNVSNILSSGEAHANVHVEQPVGELRLTSTSVSLDHPYVVTGEGVQLEAISTGDNLLYFWTIKKDQTKITDANSPILKYQFSAPGTYVVSLEAKNGVSINSTSLTIFVEDKVTYAHVNVSRLLLNSSESVFLLAEYQGPSSCKFLWRVGDMNKTTQSFMKTFLHAGTYNVSLVVYNNVSSVSDHLVINVQDPIFNFHLDSCSRIQPSQVSVNLEAGLDTGTDVDFQWIISSSTVYHGQIIQHTFPTAGNYNVTIRASNLVSQAVLSCLVAVQDRVKISSVLIRPNRGYLFINHTVNFKAVPPKPSVGHTTYTWLFSGATAIEEHTFTESLSYVFQSAGNYELNLHAENNVSSVDFGPVMFTIHALQCDLPVPAPVGSRDQTVLKSRSIDLEVMINSDCSVYAAVHSWEVFSGSVCNSSVGSSVDLGNTLVSSPALHIAPRVLDYGVYCVRFVTGYESTPVREETSFSLTVTSSPLVAIIAGGSERFLSFGNAVTLDASLSYDPDLGSSSLPSTVLYQWTCTDSNTPSGCPSLGSGSEISLPAGLLPTGSYVFTLTLTEGSRTASARQKVVISGQTLPMVSLECVSCKATNVYRISSGQHVALSGSCGSCSGCVPQYQWEITRDDNVTFVPEPSMTTTGMNSANFVLHRGHLLDSHGYTFRLKVSCSGYGQAGEAALTLESNQPPSGGHCQIFPLTVSTLEPVSINCTGWSDPDGEELYEVRVDRGADHGGVYRLYQGPRSALSVYVAPWPDTSDTVSLLVYVVDGSGAATLAQSSTVTITEPSLSSTGDRTEHLWNHALTKLPELINQNNPVFLLQYVIALCQELNHESLQALPTPHSNLTGMRATIRDAATLSLAGISVASLQDAQQLSLALQLLTNFSTEYQTQGSHLLVMQSLETVVTLLQTAASPGRDQDEFVPEFLLSTISNIFTAVNLGIYSSSSVLVSSRPSSLESFYAGATNLRPEITHAMQSLDFTSSEMDESHRRAIVTSAFEVADEITAIVLQTKVLEESSVTFQLGAIEVHGQRSRMGDVWTQRPMGGCLFSLPQGLLGAGSQSEEIFQVMFVLPQNPFTWGYIDNMEISSRVPVLTFKYTNGSSISVRDLPDSQRIKILMFDSDGLNYTLQSDSLIGSQYYQPLEKLDYRSMTIEGGKDKKVNLDVSRGTSGVSAVQVQVRVAFQNDAGQNAGSNSSIAVYLGVDYEASRDRYEQYKVIYSHYMADGTDHRLYTFFISAESFSSSSTYSLSVYNQHSEAAVQLWVAVYLSSCQYFNTDTQQWDSQGCTVSDESIAVCTVCSCNHLTSFGGGVLVPPNALDFSDLAQAILTNPAVMVTISVLLVLYILAVLLLRRLDLADLKRISNIPLCGVDGSFKYEITIYTGRQIGAGTSAHVGLRLYGENGKTQCYHLAKPDAFGRNCQDKFLVAHDVGLGEIQLVQVWHDNYGTSPAWFLQHIEIQDLASSKRSYFFANAWLSLEVENGVIEKHLRLAGPEELKSFKQKFKRSACNIWAEKHMWMSIFDRPDHSRFSRVQRVTVCITLIYVYMCASAMWYGLLKGGATARDPVTWAAIGWEEVVVAIAAAAVALPIGIILVLIFKKSRPKANMLEILQKPPSAQSLEIDDQCGGLYPDHSFRTLTPELLSNYDRESTSDSLPVPAPITTGLRRTRNLTSSKPRQTETSSSSGLGSSKSKSSVQSIQRTVNLMWSRDNIMKWPEKMPWSDELGGEIGARKLPPSIPGPSHPINPPCHPSQQTFHNRIHSPEDSDEEFEQRLAEIDRMEQQRINERNKSLSKTSSSRTRKTSSEVDDLFSSDDEWAHDDLDAIAPDHAQGLSRKPAAPLHPAKFNPREEPAIRPGTERKLSTSSILKQPPPGSAGHRPGSKEVSFVSRDLTHHSLGSKSHSTLSSSYWRRMSLQPMAEPVRPGCLLPPWCVYLAYSLCLALSVFSTIIVLLYGYKFGPAVSAKWIVSLLLITLISFFIVEPIKILVWTLYTACSSRSVEEEQDNDVFEVQPSEKSNEVIKDVKFRPMAGFALLQAKEEGRKVHRMGVMIRQSVVYLVMLTLLLVNCYLYYSPDSYRLSSTINTTVSLPRDPSGLALHNLSSIPDFWQWTQSELVQALHHRDLVSTEAFPALLGLPRLRQIRGTTVDCPIQSHLNLIHASSLERECQGQMEFVEDTMPHSAHWNSSGNLSWQYHSASQLNMASKQGSITLYGGGGYTQLLGASINDTISILQDLQDKDWVDLNTRAVFIEFTMYLPSQDLTSVASILVEFPLSGGLISRVDIQTQKLLRFIEWVVDALMITEVLFVLCVVYLLVHIVISMQEKGRQFFTSLWSWLELLTSLLAMACVGVYVGCVVTATEAFRHYRSHQPPAATTFTNFDPTAQLHVALRYMHAWLVFLFFLKIVKQARFIRCLHVFEKTISNATWLLVGCFVIFILLLCSYAQLGYLMFGVEFAGFQSFEATMLSLVGVIRGSLTLEEKLDKQPVFCHFFFFSFYSLVYGLFIGLVIAVLNSTYKLTRSQMYYKASLDAQDYEMIEFMMKRFKLLMGLEKPKPPFQRVRFEGLPSLPSRSTHSSRSSRSETDSLASDTSRQDASTQYMEYLIDRVAPQWQNIVTKMHLMEQMDREEELQTKKLEKAVKDWQKKHPKSSRQAQQKQQPKQQQQPVKIPERRHSQPNPSGKPPLDPSSRFARFKANLQSSAANAMKGTSRISVTPPSGAAGSQARLMERPSSDQSPRHAETLARRPASDSQPKRSLLVDPVRSARKAWSPEEQS